jgi:peptide-methionine (R)-S-oxide reductase
MKTVLVMTLIVAGLGAAAYAVKAAPRGDGQKAGAPAQGGRVNELKPDAQGKVVLTDAQWREILTSDQYRVLRKQGTERAYTGDTWDNHAKGTYVCAACGQPLFSSDTKFESGTGWPSFYQPLSEKAVETETDGALGMIRTEVHCSRCGGHLGHVFPDGPKPTGLRYCMNSVSMRFVPAAK